MNSKFLFLFGFAAISALAYGALSNNIEITTQDILQYKGLSSFGPNNFQCACENPNDPNDFDVGWCELNPDNEGYVGDNAMKLCSWETPLEDYGGLLEYNEGCDSNFWKTHSDYKSEEYAWPADFSPDYMYGDIFQISFDESVGSEMTIKELKDKYKKMIKDLKDEFKAKKKIVKKLAKYDDEIDAKKTIEELKKQLKKMIKEFKKDLAYEKKFLKKLIKSEKKFFDITLLEALDSTAHSDKTKKLRSESVAALLNAAHQEISYNYNVNEIMSMIQESFLPTKIAVIGMNDVIVELKEYNSMGDKNLCP